jgi:hypothetical protein
MLPIKGAVGVFVPGLLAVSLLVPLEVGPFAFEPEEGVVVAALAATVVGWGRGVAVALSPQAVNVTMLSPTRKKASIIVGR